ncbi:type II secretion system F family protein [uncultured Pseudokineococcus sp.]|uniref:type II secretion system F family protein n=1 Tax=uncultured Pseudokineococcus sp. TaxID=1642928 RepID=UPI0026153CB5|nr:type II secretion system F family protein [uncultured Pseudokineococcus sp.]
MTGVVVGLLVLAALAAASPVTGARRLRRLVTGGAGDGRGGRAPGAGAGPDGDLAGGTGGTSGVGGAGGHGSGAAPSVEAVAQDVSRLAVLLRAGLAPGPAWAHLAGAAGPGPGGAWTAAARAAAAGAPTAPALHAVLRDGGLPAEARGATSALAAALDVCERTGAPAALVLHRLAGALREEADARDAREAALAAPRATARVLLALPVLGLALGHAVGAAPLAVLVGTGPGRLAAVVGAVLAATGWWWTRRLVASATVAPGSARRRDRAARAGRAA